MDAWEWRAFHRGMARGFIGGVILGACGLAVVLALGWIS